MKNITQEENVNSLMRGSFVTGAHLNMPNLEVKKRYCIFNTQASNSCVSCRNDVFYYIKFALFFAIQVGLILYSIM